MIDITIDFETCALLPTAAVICVAAVAWNRNGIYSPFYAETEKYPHDFFAPIDIRGMYIDGFDFDKKTQEWWSNKSEAVKNLLTAPDENLSPIDVVLKDLNDWINGIKLQHNNEDYYLWCQGSDFDIPLIRNICHKYQLDFPINHKHIRDHRTYFYEGAKMICDLTGCDFDENRAYFLVDEYCEKKLEHNPLYDCKRSIHATWQMMKHLKCLTNAEKK